jgi:hypothetical protein
MFQICETQIDMPRLGSFFGFFLAVFSVESFDTAGRIDQFLLAGEKRVAFRADFKVDLRLRRSRLESFAAGALHECVDVVGMYVCFHRASSNARMARARNSLLYATFPAFPRAVINLKKIMKEGRSGT